jgi:hypothetical protein
MVGLIFPLYTAGTLTRHGQGSFPNYGVQRQALPLSRRWVRTFSISRTNRSTNNAQVGGLFQRQSLPPSSFPRYQATLGDGAKDHIHYQQEQR